MKRKWNDLVNEWRVKCSRDEMDFRSVKSDVSMAGTRKKVKHCHAVSKVAIDFGGEYFWNGGEHWVHSYG